MSTKLIKIVKTFGVFVKKKTCYINKSEKKRLICQTCLV